MKDWRDWKSVQLLESLLVGDRTEEPSCALTAERSL